MSGHPRLHSVTILHTYVRFFSPSSKPSLASSCILKVQIRAPMSCLKIPSGLRRTLFKCLLTPTKPFRVAPAYLPSFIFRHPQSCTARRFPGSRLSSTRNALHSPNTGAPTGQATASPGGRSPSGTDSFDPAPAPPAPRRYRVDHPVLQSLTWTGTGSHSSLCQRPGVQASFVG